MDISFLPDNGTAFHPGVPNRSDLASSGQKTAAFLLNAAASNQWNDCAAVTRSTEAPGSPVRSGPFPPRNENGEKRTAAFLRFLPCHHWAPRHKRVQPRSSMRAGKNARSGAYIRQTGFRRPPASEAQQQRRRDIGFAPQQPRAFPVNRQYYSLVFRVWFNFSPAVPASMPYPAQGTPCTA